VLEDKEEDGAVEKAVKKSSSVDMSFEAGWPKSNSSSSLLFEAVTFGVSPNSFAFDDRGGCNGIGGGGELEELEDRGEVARGISGVPETVSLSASLSTVSKPSSPCGCPLGKGQYSSLNT